jgi:hypothetical protein
MLSATREMNEEYQRIQKRATEDPGTAGDQGEENWAALFKDWLPPTFQIVTKGRILGHDGQASPQIDVLILKPEYPKKLLDKKLYLAGGVVAAFECKITLKASHIRDAVENSAIIRRLVPKRYGTPFKELNSPITYGILAHSHSWDSPGSTPLINIEKTLLDSDGVYTKHPREMLDIVCVSDLANWSARKRVNNEPSLTSVIEEQIISLTEEQRMAFNKGTTDTVYLQNSNESHNQTEYFTPIGAMISFLLDKIGWEFSGVRSLAEYFRLVNLGGSGNGKMINWSTKQVFSDEVLQGILTGRLINRYKWEEWSMIF